MLNRRDLPVAVVEAVEVELQRDQEWVVAEKEEERQRET